MQPEGQPRYWYRDNFFLTTDKSYLEPQAVNAVFKSDLMWWNDPLEVNQMRKMLNNCMTLSLFSVPETEEQMKSTPHFFPCLSLSRLCILLVMNPPANPLAYPLQKMEYHEGQMALVSN